MRRSVVRAVRAGSGTGRSSSSMSRSRRSWVIVRGTLNTNRKPGSACAAQPFDRRRRWRGVERGVALDSVHQPAVRLELAPGAVSAGSDRPTHGRCAHIGQPTNRDECITPTYAAVVDIPIIHLDAPDRASGDRSRMPDDWLLRVSGHGVAADAREQLIDAARRVFDLPADHKRRVELSVGRHGVAGLVPAGWRADVWRAGSEGGVLLRPRTAARSTSPARAQHLARPRCPSCGQRCAWMDAMEQVGQRVLAAMAIGLGFEADWFVQPPDDRPDGVVPHLPLPTASA